MRNSEDEFRSSERAAKKAVKAYEAALAETNSSRHAGRWEEDVPRLISEADEALAESRRCSRVFASAWSAWMDEAR